jgi:hypothetical protein
MLKKCDVAVGTPGCLSPGYQGVAWPPTGIFDLVIFDEGHHVPADTWQILLDAFGAARIALFTATPFRRDRKALPGVLAYDYPLSSAISDGVYAVVSYVPVKAASGADRDQLIASTVASRLKDKRHVAANSAFIARTDRLEHAVSLVDVYQAEGLKARMVSGRDSRAKVKTTLRELMEGSINGVVTVGVLGEGLDQPRLKIAAYHRPHKSLAPTLQFVGRISRILKDAEAPAELIAIPEDVRDETRRLYEEDASWAELVPMLMDSAVVAEQARAAYIAELEKPPMEEFSMYALQPRKETQIFTFDDPVDPDLTTKVGRLGNGQVIHSATDEDGSLLVLVSAHRWHPDWLRSDALDSIEYQLHIAVVDRSRRVLFVSTTSEAALETILDAVGASSARRVAGRLMNRILYSEGVESYFSVGMRSATPPGGRRAAYTTLAGKRVDRAVSPTAARSHGLGHMIGRVRDDTGQFSALGVSVNKAKVWVPDTANLYEYKLWCYSLSKAVRDWKDEGVTAPGLPLSLPVPLDAFPEHPFSVLLDEAMINEGVVILREGNPPIPAWEASVDVRRLDPQTCRIEFAAEDEVLWSGIAATDGSIVAQNEVKAFESGHPPAQDFSDLLRKYPPSIYFAGGGVATASMLILPSANFPPLPPEVLSTWDWSNVDIRSEAREPKTGMENIINRSARWIRENWPESVIIQEDGKGEIADLLSVRESSSEVQVDFFHCKWSSGDNPGHRLDDLYQVVGQAMRSTTWTTLPDVFWTRILQRLNNRSKTYIHAISQWGEDKLTAIAAMELPTRFRISIVQPGLSLSSLSSWQDGTNLLGACDAWCQSEGVSLHLVGS